ncbi:MAG: hypothetical protein AAB930_00700 [Patescibacteria group bacterium]
MGAYGALCVFENRNTALSGGDEEIGQKIRNAKDSINRLFLTRGYNALTVEDERALVDTYHASLIIFRSRLVFSEVGDSEIEDTNSSDPSGWDDAEQNYVKQKFFEVGERLDVVKNLRHEAQREKKIKEEPEDDERKFLRRHWLEYRENNPSPYAPTIGIEVEIREESIMPEELRKDKIRDRGNLGESTSDLYYKRERIIEKIRPLYKKTIELGVPYGYDKFWEFSHRPTKNYLTLSREVQALIEMNLINKEDQKHPLHLTIGGIWCGEWNPYAKQDSTSSDEKEAFVLARVLEASGWRTRGRRLLRPFYAKRDCWAVKGNAGLLQKEKEHDKLEFGAENAVEIRTLQLQTITGLDRLLRSAYLLAASLKSYQEEKKLPGYFSKSEERKNLIEIWTVFSQKAKEIFIQFGLDDPSSTEHWKNPRYYDDSDLVAENKEGFFGLAALLDEAEQDSRSRGRGFVKAIRKLIIETRAKISPIIYPKENSQFEKS